MKRKLGLALLVLTGCMTASQHSANLHSSAERELTVGIVQRDIHKGMSQSAVAESLGSPNIVSRDSGGLETWVYDKVASESSYSNDSGGVGAVVGGGWTPGSGLVAGVGSTRYDASAGAAATTQKTLTVIIKFDSNGQVLSSGYHSTRF